MKEFVSNAFSFVILVYILVIFYCYLPHDSKPCNFDCFNYFKITNLATPKHLQINDFIMVLLKKGVSTLESETKTVEIKDPSAINTILGCVVQSYENTSLHTDSPNFIKTQITEANSIITVMYQPISQTRIKEVYNINTKHRLTHIYEKTTSVDPIQYVQIGNNDRVITYFGNLGQTLSSDKFWIKTFNAEKSRHLKSTWKTSFHTNTNILCIR